MSTRLVPTIVCDGCGTVIETDYHLKISIQNQDALPPDLQRETQRDFCCEACEKWWRAEFPASGPWGPAWDDRAWWWEHIAPDKHATHLRTAHEENPLTDNKVHFESPEKTPTVG